MIARLTVHRDDTTEYPLAERVDGGWQNGATFYADAEVTAFTELDVRVLPPAEPESVLGDCTDAADCTAPVHDHGCPADIGNCDQPTEHDTPAEPHSDTGHTWPCPLYYPSNWTPDALPLTTCTGTCAPEPQGDTDG